MLRFSSIYHPLTSRPFLSDCSYQEYSSCEALRPYIACYWTTGVVGDGEKEVLVIPDTCVDLIIDVDHERQMISGRLCGIQDQPYRSVRKDNGDKISCFAIRFYFWSASLFFSLDFKDARNHFIDLLDLGREWKVLFEPFFYLTETYGRIQWVEAFLCKKLDLVKWNPSLYNGIHQILTTSGKASVKEICAYSCVSQRQMERLFLREIGLPLKRVASLVRYQHVWKDMIFSRSFDIQDTVCRYGYTDQAHLLNEFKRFHGVAPGEARMIAYKNR